MHLVECIKTHRNYGVPMWDMAVSYKEISEMVRCYMPRMFAAAIVWGVEPYLAAGNQWAPLVQWSFRALSVGSNVGKNATREEIWFVEQDEFVSGNMLHSPTALFAGYQREVPSTDFPSLRYATDRLSNGAIAFHLRPVGMEAPRQGCSPGDILMRAQAMQDSHRALQASDNNPLQYFLYDRDGLSPTHLQPQDGVWDPGAEFGGKY